jgi:uncharacterized SAM-binding protein YcdF (DUF218 family)
MPQAEISRKKRWLRTGFILATLLIGLYFLVPASLNGLARGLIRRDALQSADVVIALSGDAQCLREKYAAELYRQGRARKILVGGFAMAWGIHTGEAAKRFLVHEGIPAADVMVLKDTWNTRVEAELLVQQMRQHGWRSALVVTDSFHSRRALYTIEPVARDFHFSSQPLPEELSRWRPERWWTRRGDMWLTVREGLSWLNTLVGGLQ